jgi:hypothetical protein
MTDSDENRGRGRRSGVEDQRWSHRSSTRWPDDVRSGDAVCGLHRARGDEGHMFLGSASKSRLMVCQWFSLKTTETVCQWFDLKTTVTVSPDLTSKPAATVR